MPTALSALSTCSSSYMCSWKWTPRHCSLQTSKADANSRQAEQAIPPDLRAHGQLAGQTTQLPDPRQNHHIAMSYEFADL